MEIASVVLLPGMNPNWLSCILVHCLILLPTTLSHILKVCDRSLRFHGNFGTPVAKTINVFRACLCAQLTICVQKWRNFVLFSTVSLRFVLSRVCVFLYSLGPRMSPFPLKISINILCRQADGICSVFIMQLNNLHRIFIPKLPIYFHASADISSASTAIAHSIPLSALYVSSSLMFRV